MSAAPAGQDPVHQDQVLKVRRLVDADDAAEPVLDAALPVGVDRVSFSELVLEAASEAEFVEMLRQIQKRSGRSAGKISAYTGGVVPRATAYHFVAATTKRMPTRREQLEKFVIACGLNPIQVQRVLWLWDQLREDTAAAKAQAASRDSVVEGVLVEQTSGALVLRSGQELVSQAGAERVSEEFAGFAGSVHTLVVKGDFRVEHHHHHHHDEAGRRDDRGEQKTQAGAGGGEESPSGRRGVLSEALKDPRMFRHLMLLLTFVAVFALGTVSLVIVSVVKAPTTTIMIPVMVVMAAGVALVRLAYGFPDLPGLRERRRGEPPSV